MPRLPFEVEITRIIPGGRGLAFHEGRPLFAAGVVPGDRLQIHSFRDRKSYLEASGFVVADPSPDRREAPCPYYGKCGGCDFQHMTEERQLLAKKEILLDALARIGQIRPDPGTIRLVSSPPWHYRNRLQIKIGQVEGNSNWGYFQTSSHEIIAVDQCRIAREPLWNWMLELRDLLKSRPEIVRSLTGMEVMEGDRGQFMVELETGEQEEQAGGLAGQLKALLAVFCEPDASINLRNEQGRRWQLAGPGFLEKSVEGKKYRVSHGAFFQINDLLLCSLREVATSGYRGRKALDLFCGGGFFTLALADSFEEVVAVEVNAAAVADLRAVLETTKVSNCRVVAIELESYFRRVDSRDLKADLVLLDPPRSGLPKDAVEKVAALGTKDVVYVSCDPATLARDLRIFLGRDYRIDSLTLLDLFPQTHHLETVARLKRFDSPGADL
jgi:23S rRNA (uracil1939-C5)-methyltransferase